METTKARYKDEQGRIEARTAPPAYRDEWGFIHCSCGNTPDDDGLESCSPNGEHMEPMADSDWQGHYICNRCGRIIEPELKIA